MGIPLNEFEQHIDESILKRGLSYFKKGRVHEPEEISDGKYEAIVEGTEDYTVQLTIKKGIITEYICDCPYDMGSVCKHVVALIFYLQKDEIDLGENSLKPIVKPKNNPPKRKTIADQVNELLEKATHDELKQFVRDKTEENKLFRNLFLSSFVQHNTNESKEFYVKQVKSILRTSSDRHGFIDWNAARHVGLAIDKLLDSAEKQIASNNYKSAVFISTAIMEQMVDALQYSDDSNGDIGGPIDLAFELLQNIALEPISEEVRVQIIEYCLNAFDKEIYSGWDWHIGVLRIASTLSKTVEETKRIIKLIDKLQKSEYEREEAQTIMYDIILKTQGEKEAEKYLELNIGNADLRRIAIQKAVEKKNYKKAISIAQDGINFDKKDKPGLVYEWYEWLLKISQAQNATEKIIEYARLLFINDFSRKPVYYQILKQNINPKKWSAFVEEIVHDLTKGKRWVDTNLVGGIFVKEEWWSKLLDLVKENPDLHTIEQYEKYLILDYKRDVVDLYAHAITSYIANNTGRDHYQIACKYLRRIIKLGSRDKATELITFFRVEYPRRIAFMEELNKI